MMKNFGKVNSGVGAIVKVFCLSDCSFIVNEDQEIFFCGKYSHKSISLIKYRITFIEISSSRVSSRL